MIRIAAASGNIFGYLWAAEAPAGLGGDALARAICPRGKGLGLDGLFLLQRPVLGEPWIMEHWEPDGSRTFCSNGTRAAASLLPPEWRGYLEAVVSGERVSLRLEAERVGLRLPEGHGYGFRTAALPLEAPHAYGWTGTPHLVIEVPEVDGIDLAAFAPPWRHHRALPNGANVSIVQILRPGHARIRSWERGVEGETLCCGQGCAVAGAWLARRTGLSRWLFKPAGADSVIVTLGGLEEGRWSELWLAGPVHRLGSFVPEDALLDQARILQSPPEGGQGGDIRREARSG